MNTLTKTPLVLSLACGMLMTACTKKPESAPTPQEEPKTVTTTTTTVPITPNCDDIGVKNSLARALATATNDKVATFMNNFDDADKLDLARRTQQRLGDLSLNLQNIHPDGDTCLADMVVVLPKSDIDYANRYYKSTSKLSLNELAQSYSLNLSDDRLASSVRYNVQNGQAVLSDSPSALELIADVMSSSAYQMAKNESRINTNTRPISTVQPLAPSQSSSPKPVLQEPELDASSTTQPTNTDVPSDSTSTPPDTTSSSAPSSNPSSTPITDTAPTDDNDGLTIIESDETY